MARCELTVRPLTSQPHLGADRVAAVGRRQLRADHQLGQLLAVTSAGSTVATVVPADDGDVVADGEHLVELVRDEDDGDALVDQLAQVGEQLVDLLRHQHGGGLVEDEDAAPR
jgi:hypothetical protein